MKLTFFLLMIICLSTDSQQHHVSNYSPTKYVVTEIDKEAQTKQISIQDSTKIYGIEQIGSFKLYTHQPFESSKYQLYKGDPKVEILDKKGKVIKTIDIIKSQQLLPKYDSISPHPNLRNMFRIHLTDSQDVYDYINTDYFGHVKPMPNLFYEVRYEVNNGVLWIQNIARGMNTDVYGGQTEIIGIDSSGNEIIRFQLKGWLASMNATKKNTYISVITGGQATERVEYFNPKSYYAINVIDEKTIYKYYSEDDCILGGTSMDYLYATFIKNRNFGSNMKGLYKVIILFPEKNTKYIIREDMIPKGSVPLFKEDHLEFHISGKKNIIKYFDEFKAFPLNY